MEVKLSEAFSPERLSVINESHLHAGHHHVENGETQEFDGEYDFLFFGDPQIGSSGDTADASPARQECSLGSRP